MAGSRFKTALVLSGGSARALTHLGVLAELLAHRIVPDLIVGTSMGAVIGALFAYYRDMQRVKTAVHGLVESDLFLRTISAASEERPYTDEDGFFNRFLGLFRKGVYYTHSLTRSALIAESTYLEIMTDLIPDCDLQELSIRFAAIAMDPATGEEIVITRGSLVNAVSASAAIPGILPQVEHENRMLVDGGWLDNVPVAPAIALGAHFVLAVDASLDIPGLGPMPTAAIEHVFRCNEITRIRLMQHRKQHADVLVTPRIGETNWSHFSCIDRCSTAGRDAVREALPLIHRQILRRKARTLGGRFHPARRRGWRHPFLLY
ncbi:MAG: patatin-like phospholipase family protein [Syntrophobacteraceae bacterium]